MRQPALLLSTFFIAIFCLSSCPKYGGESKSAEPEIGKEYFPQGTNGGPMVYVPAGEFMMGCNEEIDKQCRENEEPYHKVYLDAFYIDKYEVTMSDYAACVDAGKCNEPGGQEEDDYCSWGHEKYGDLSKYGKLPVNCVDWDSAVTFCTYANKRLPTEAEWEKAARGTDGRIYPWGNETATCDYAAMYDDNGPYSYSCGIIRPWPVGSMPKGASPYGAIDMAGNMWEWCSDWYDANYYKISPAKNPKGPSTGDKKSNRSGSYNDTQVRLRVSYRDYDDPGSKYFGQGFRCAKSAR